MQHCKTGPADLLDLKDLLCFASETMALMLQAEHFDDSSLDAQLLLVPLHCAMMHCSNAANVQQRQTLGTSTSRLDGSQDGLYK